MNTKPQRAVIAHLLRHPEDYGKYADLTELIVWDEPYKSIYGHIKNGTKSFFVIAEQKDVAKQIPNTQDFFVQLLKEPEDILPSQTMLYAAEQTNKVRVISELENLIMGNPTLDSLISHLNSISATISTMYRDTTYDMEKLNTEQNKAIEQHMAGKAVSLVAGIGSIQRQTMGWHGGHLTVIGANSSAGKTAFMLTCLKMAAKTNTVKTAIVSYEMTPREIHARLLSEFCEVQPRDILYSKLTDDEYRRVHKAYGILEKIPIVVERPEGSGIEELLAKIRVLVNNGVKLVGVDYLQLVHDKNIKERRLAIGMIARSLKNLAVELNIPILVLSQLNRDNTKNGDKRPNLSSLRDSGEIEEAADEVILLFRPEYFMQPDEVPPELAGRVEVIFAKGRSTGIGSEMMYFEPKYQIFTDEKFVTDYKDYTGGRGNLEPSTEF